MLEVGRGQMERIGPEGYSIDAGHVTMGSLSPTDKVHGEQYKHSKLNSF